MSPTPPRPPLAAPIATRCGHRRHSHHLTRCALGAVLLHAAACGPTDGPDPADAPPDPRWGALISARTHGTISKRDRITVVFTQNVAGEYLVGRPTSGVLLLEPEIEGAATFVSASELVFAATGDLPSGQVFRARIVREALLGLPDDLGDYAFTFEVIPQAVEVVVDGLEAESADADEVAVTGTLVTADFAEPEAVEQALTADQRGADPSIEWRHDAEGTVHRFTVRGVARGGRDEVLRLRWNGRDIGAPERGSYDVLIPAEDAFRVTSVRAESDDRQYAMVRFSDPLDPSQNLAGLVSLGAESFTVEVQGNAMRIIPVQRVVGAVRVAIEPGVRSAGGRRIEERSEAEVVFTEVKPGVRFAGRGVVLPTADRLTVPIEVAGVHSLQVTALRVYETNIGQFLQNNDLSGERELQRTGRALWRRTIELPQDPGGGWIRHNLDVSDVVRGHPGDLIRLTLSINRGNSTFACSAARDGIPVLVEPAPPDLDPPAAGAPQAWDEIDESYQGSLDWRDRDDPCTDAYYRWSWRTSAARNFLASNIGITVKRDARGGILVATTDLRTSEAMRGVSVAFMDYRNQRLGTVLTGPDGLGRTTLEETPHYAAAIRGGERGYLTMSRGTALPTSHFDAGGQVVAEGLKGAIYGERDVWRPGDSIHLTFVLDDRENPLPDGHPATLQLLDPLGQVVHAATNADPIDGFHVFALGTAPDAPTGNWNAAVEVGGARFSAPIRVETVMPNRLRVELALGPSGQPVPDDGLVRGAGPHDATLFGQWLSGAAARALDADVQVSFQPIPTAFPLHSDYVFDDPAREYSSEPLTVFDGALDDDGNAAFAAHLAPGGHSPGMLAARFTTRVFEEGGAFSTNRRSLRFSPYDRYVGVMLPPGDAVRGMLLTDTTHTARIAILSPDGEPVSADSIDVALYKIGWRWWWDRSAESLARFTESEHTALVAEGRIAAVDGLGTWDFAVNYPEWGRYLLRACDAEGGHCTGRTVYIDWPGWAGRAREESDAGASVLTLLADRDSYVVGDVAEIQLPEANAGRALVTLETGSRILDGRWVELGGERTRFEVPITEQMSPNVYVGVSLIQPHADRANDRPIRLHGVIPLAVEDPRTVLRPRIGVPEVWLPDTTVSVRVSEESGRAMTYTLAVVDEGLLGLTNFRTPDLHDRFYSREALGVTTWDIFDEVAGAYAAELERLLALGGDDAANIQEQERSRFPPVVRFMGPLRLGPGEVRPHRVDLPNYIGQVRVMVVAGLDGAYGSASESVFVRQPLSMLATAPRVVGPGEEITVPVSLFAMEDGIERATVTLAASGPFEVVGGDSETVVFDGAQERMARLRVRAADRPGAGVLRFTAVAGEHTAQAEIALPVRTANPETTNQVRARIAPGEGWSTRLAAHGIPGTNSANLEVTPFPPLNLGARLGYLVRYPHGCLEQIVSAVFPQLHLPRLTDLDDADLARVEEAVRAGIDRLRGFQTPAGGFSYWPGGRSAAWDRDGWVTSYAGHFLVEAQRLGYPVDPAMISTWRAHQRRRARSWRSAGDTPAMDQSYRLYTLALAGDHELGAMNRLRETPDLAPAARWHLAAAYRLAGVEEAADPLVRADDAAPEYARPGWSMGSRLRDRAILLDALVALDRRAEASDVAEEISGDLDSDDWHSTHSIAYALMAMARFHGVGDGAPAAARGFTFERRAGDDTAAVTSLPPILSEDLTAIAEEGSEVAVANTSDVPLFVTLVTRGSPAAGDEEASSSGLAVRVVYTDLEGTPLDVAELRQGTDLVATVVVLNETRRDLRDLALEYRAPSGWEIHNRRLNEAEERPDDDRIEHQDVRDDRILTYFSLDEGESITLPLRFNAAYLGDYYLPTVSVEAMYDGSVHGRTRGMPVRVVEGEGG